MLCRGDATAWFNAPRACFRAQEYNAKGEVIDAYTSWEWSTLCDEVTKLEVDLHPANLIVLPKVALANGNTSETTPSSGQVFASDIATPDQSEVISDGYQWRRWESNPRPISSGIVQPRVIMGNQILSQGKQKAAKSTFGKTFCQLAK